MTLDEEIQQQEQELWADLTAMGQEICSDSRAAMLFAETLLDDVCGRIDMLDSSKLNAQQHKEHFDVLASWLKDCLPLMLMALQCYSSMMGYSELQNERMKIQAGGQPYQKGEAMLAKMQEKHAHWVDTLFPFLETHGTSMGIRLVKKDDDAIAATAQGSSTVH
ncbi:hypothetical protein [Conchiformibius steedae]|uniref:hypothetical protein n=1 Tax=Conchiformibius steedae TaxID=153493 RepID=UPI0026F13F03|nr:hypothetical protein [Conchiformibius steedae]